MTPEITAEITDLIKKKAEDFAKNQIEKTTPEMPIVDKAFIKIISESYTTGQIEAIEMMIGFTEWMADNDVTLWSKNDLGGGKTHQLEYDDRFYTTIELLTKYIKEVLSK